MSQVLTAEEFDDQIAKSPKSIMKFALKFCKGRREESEDLVNDTIVLALKYRTKFTEGTNIIPWLYRIMFNKFLDSQKRLKVKNTVDMGDDTLNFLIDSNFNSGIGQEDRVELVEVLQYIDKMQDFHKNALMSSAFGFSLEEISEEEKIPIGTVKSRVNRARADLRHHFAVYSDAKL